MYDKPFHISSLFQKVFQTYFNVILLLYSWLPAWYHQTKFSNQTFVNHHFLLWYIPHPSVSIATGYGLGGQRIKSRWGARFSAPVQTGPGAHPASYTVGTGCFLGVESARGVTLTPHPLLVPRSKNRVRLYLYYP
jgi:hypothetical protein